MTRIAAALCMALVALAPDPAADAAAADTGAVRRLIQQLGSADPQAVEEARVALEKSGAAAVPALIDAMKRDLSGQVRSGAADVLGRIGPAAMPAIPTLLEALSDPEVGLSASSALAAMKADVVPELIQAMSSPRENARTFAVHTFTLMDTAPASALAALTRAVGDPSTRVGYFAAGALGKMGPAARPALPALLEALKSDDTTLGWRAAEVLGAIGPTDPLVIKGLTEGVRQRANPALRIHASVGLRKVGVAAKAAVPDLIAGLSDADGTVRQVSAEALASMGPEARAAVPRLTQLLTDPQVKTPAVDALGAIGPAAGPAVPRLAALLDDPEVGSLNVLDALKKIGPGAAAATPALVKRLEDPEPWMRMKACELLTAIGPGAAAALPALRQHLKDASWQVRDCAAGAIAKIQAR